MIPTKTLALYPAFLHIERPLHNSFDGVCPIFVSSTRHNSRVSSIEDQFTETVEAEWCFFGTISLDKIIREPKLFATKSGECSRPGRIPLSSGFRIAHLLEMLFLRNLREGGRVLRGRWAGCVHRGEPKALPPAAAEPRNPAVDQAGGAPPHSPS
eukprot:CAMPEP_0114536908 /NCGR_PEP_ID=MMETSP0109-20121206/29269_1 /TAXON_ID=29199 /ORGANISM="Chlorarachnion reptans, Strain CCCM449" /LENGTH=154 /DNA_ID=CAMNT_0001720709 /DNA_START=36 /DNA_END=500 /DNA_ORIENTATION=-